MEQVFPFQAPGDGQVVKTMVVGTNVQVIGPICVMIKHMATREILIIGVNNWILIVRLTEDYVDVGVNNYWKFRNLNLRKSWIFMFDQ